MTPSHVGESPELARKRPWRLCSVHFVRRSDRLLGPARKPANARKVEGEARRLCCLNSHAISADAGGSPRRVDPTGSPHFEWLCCLGLGWACAVVGPRCGASLSTDRGRRCGPPRSPGLEQGSRGLGTASPGPKVCCARSRQSQTSPKLQAPAKAAPNRGLANADMPSPEPSGLRRRGGRGPPGPSLRQRPVGLSLTDWELESKPSNFLPHPNSAGRYLSQTKHMRPRIAVSILPDGRVVRR